MLSRCPTLSPCSNIMSTLGPPSELHSLAELMRLLSTPENVPGPLHTIHVTKVSQLLINMPSWNRSIVFIHTVPNIHNFEVFRGFFSQKYVPIGLLRDSILNK